MLPYYQQPQAYRDWQRQVTQRMGHLSKPQAVVLAMWSFGIALTQACGLSTVSVFLAALLEQSESTARERLRQWYKEASQKGSRKRAEFDVSASFLPLLRWVLSWWGSTERQVMLAADATSLSDRFTVLVISVVYRGCGLPVAWKVLPGNTPGAWKPHWLALLEHLKGGIPEDWFVVVATDRGLYAPWLYEAIRALHWHPFMRIQAQGHYRPTPNGAYQSLATVVTTVGQSWSGTVRCFKEHPLDCTLLARWDEGYADPWLILTDLAPEQANVCWYGCRSWIEALFKDFKRGGFGWHHTKMKDPQRVERLWLAMAVATLWFVSVGGPSQAQPTSNEVPPPASPQPPASSPQPPALPQPPTRSQRSSTTTPLNAASAPPTLPPKAAPRWLSCLRQGFLVILAALIKGQPIPFGQFCPDPLPMPAPG